MSLRTVTLSLSLLESVACDVNSIDYLVGSTLGLSRWLVLLRPSSLQLLEGYSYNCPASIDYLVGLNHSHLD